MSFRTALLELEEIGMKRDCVLSILLYNSVANESLTIEQVENEYGASIAHIIRGLVRIHELYRKSPVIESENFRNLLLSFAEDMRVVLIMISERVVLMRYRNERFVRFVRFERFVLWLKKRAICMLRWHTSWASTS